MKRLFVAFVLCICLSFVLGRPYEDEIEDLRSLLKLREMKDRENSLYERMLEVLGVEKKCENSWGHCTVANDCCGKLNCVRVCDEGGCKEQRVCGERMIFGKK